MCATCSLMKRRAQGSRRSHRRKRGLSGAKPRISPEAMPKIGMAKTPSLHGPRRRRSRATRGELPLQKIFYHVRQNAAVGKAELAINQERQRVVPGEQGEDPGSPQGVQPVLDSQLTALVILLEGMEVCDAVQPLDPFRVFTAWSGPLASQVQVLE